MARVRPVRGRMGVRLGPRRVPFGGGGRPGPFGGGYGVHTVISELDGEYRVRLFIDGEYQAGADYFTDDVVEANETAKAMEEDAYLSDKSSDVARGEAEDFVEDAIDRPHVGEEFSALPSADRAMLTHAASGEPPRLGRAHPERPSGSPPYEPLPELPPEQMERNREGVRKARETLGSSPVGGQQSMEQTFAPAIEQSRQSLGLSTTDQMLLMAALAAVTGGGSAALRAAPLVGRGALAGVAGLGALVGGASPAHAASDSDMGAAGGSAVGDIRRRRALLADRAAGRGRTRGQR
jgi:hypothetical protein